MRVISNWIRKPPEVLLQGATTWFQCRLQSLACWFKGVKTFFQVRMAFMRLSLSGNLRESLTAYFSQLKAEAKLNPQAGFSVAWLEAMIVGIILLVVVIQFLVQQGIPEIISSSSNTTALEAAGADAATVGWVGFIGRAVVIFLLIGALIVGIRIATGGGMGSVSRRFRRKRK